MIPYDPATANFRLSGTIIRFDGEPVLIDHVDTDELSVCFQKAFSSVLCKESISSPLFDVSAFTPGYVNFQHTACFVSRMHARQYRQGMSVSNLSSPYFWSRASSSFGVLYPLALSMKGIFPSLKTVLDKQKKGVWKVRGVSQKIAISQDKKVLYCGNEIGRILRGDIQLAPFYQEHASKLLKGVVYE